MTKEQVWCEHCRDRFPKYHYDDGGNHLVGAEYGPTGEMLARPAGRRSIGIELNPEYCDLAARRLQQLSLLALVWLAVGRREECGGRHRGQTVIQPSSDARRTSEKPNPNLGRVLDMARDVVERRVRAN